MIDETNDKLQDEIVGILGKEIIKELLSEYDFPNHDEVVDNIWSRCKGNPWSAPGLYVLLYQRPD